jgi:hypothetical protein
MGPCTYGAVVPALSAVAVTAVLSDAAFVSSDTTVAVLSASVAVGWLLQLLRVRAPAKAGMVSKARAAERKKERFM